MANFRSVCNCNHLVSEHAVPNSKGDRKCNVWDCLCKNYIFHVKEYYKSGAYVVPDPMRVANTRPYTLHESDEIGKKKKKNKILYISQLDKNGKIIDKPSKQRFHESHRFSDLNL